MKRITAAAVAACILLAPAPALADTTPDYCPDPPSACATITPPGSAEPFPGDAPVATPESPAPVATPGDPKPAKAPRPGLPKAGV